MKILIDERITESPKTITRLLKQAMDSLPTLLFLSKDYPGISDADILERLLPLHQYVLTSNEILHNRAIALGFTSFIITEEGKLTDKPLSYTKPRKQTPLSTKNSAEESNKNSELNRHVLETFSKKNQEGLELKRQQIRSSQVQSVNLTVGSEEFSQAIIGGFFLKVDTQPNSIEGFCLDERSSHPLSPLLFALSYLYSLHLSHLPLILHITSPKLLPICEDLINSKTQIDPIAKSVHLLLTSLPKVTLTPCSKGFFFNQMHSKLHQIKLQGMNAMVSLNFQVIASHLLDSFSSDSI